MHDHDVHSQMYSTTVSSWCKCCLQVQHPNCISLFAVYITPRKVYLVTELVTGGELLDRYMQEPPDARRLHSPT